MAERAGILRMKGTLCAKKWRHENTRALQKTTVPLLYLDVQEGGGGEQTVAQ